MSKLIENFKSGLVIFQAFDKVLPGSFIWRCTSSKLEAHQRAMDDRVAELEDTTLKSELSRFKSVENTNYGVGFGKWNYIHPVKVQGAGITILGDAVGRLSVPNNSELIATILGYAIVGAGGNGHASMRHCLRH